MLQVIMFLNMLKIGNIMTGVLTHLQWLAWCDRAPVCFTLCMLMTMLFSAEYTKDYDSSSVMI